METLTNEALPGTEQNVPAAVGGESVTPTSETKEFYEVANQLLGKQFKDNDSAVKALKDTFNYVGEYGQLKPYIDGLKSQGKDVTKLMEALTKEQSAAAAASVTEQKPAIDESKFVSKDQYEEDLWFATKQDLQEHRTLIRALSKETGKTRDEVLELPELKPLLEAKKALKTEASSRSVIHSNQIQANDSDRQKDFDEAQRTGDWTSYLAKHKGLEFKE